MFGFCFVLVLLCFVLFGLTPRWSELSLARHFRGPEQASITKTSASLFCHHLTRKKVICSRPMPLVSLTFKIICRESSLCTSVTLASGFMYSGSLSPYNNPLEPISSLDFVDEEVISKKLSELRNQLVDLGYESTCV